MHAFRFFSKKIYFRSPKLDCIRHALRILRRQLIYGSNSVCECVCMYLKKNQKAPIPSVFTKLHIITAQSGPVIYAFYATACNTLRGLLIVSIFLARNARAHSYNSSPRYDGSRPEPHSRTIVQRSTRRKTWERKLCMHVCIY